jgi:hypothetical protein
VIFIAHSFRGIILAHVSLFLISRKDSLIAYWL